MQTRWCTSSNYSLWCGLVVVGGHGAAAAGAALRCGAVVMEDAGPAQPAPTHQTSTQWARRNLHLGFPRTRQKAATPHCSRYSSTYVRTTMVPTVTSPYVRVSIRVRAYKLVHGYHGTSYEVRQTRSPLPVACTLVAQYLVWTIVNVLYVRQHQLASYCNSQVFY